MNTITQDMKFKQSLTQYALKHGVSRASRKFNKSRSYIYFWLARYDGSIDSLACLSRRPHSHPLQHTKEELSLIRNMKRRNPKLGLVEFWCRLRARGYSRSMTSLYRILSKNNMMPAKKKTKPYKPKPYQQMTFPGERIQIDVKYVPANCRIGEIENIKLYQYTAIDEFSRLRFLAGFQEQNTYSSAVFLTMAVNFFKKKGIRISCVQTDNGFEFTNRFSSSKKGVPGLFEKTAERLGIQHKLIRPYTPRHNGKVERSHREDQKKFYDTHAFFSLEDYSKQLSKHMQKSNKLPMRPLSYLSPIEFLKNYHVQYV